MVTPKQLVTDLRAYFQSFSSESFNEILASEIPKKWEKHGDCIIVPANSFQSSAWTAEALQKVCDIMKINKIARKSGSILPKDVFRRPQIQLIHGENSWVDKTENGIKYYYDVCKCMFSSGNISEKLRISSWDLSGKTVVDLYAGIGYFTLTYLVHAKAKLLYACELNPDALEALRINVRANNVAERCIILPGDNVQTCPVNCADHVNLGYIPSSEASWEAACKSLKLKTGGILHVHGNVDLKGERPWEDWSAYVKGKIQNIFDNLYSTTWKISVLEVCRIKSYGPCVDHLVVDICCKPLDTSFITT